MPILISSFCFHLSDLVTLKIHKLETAMQLNDMSINIKETTVHLAPLLQSLLSLSDSSMQLIKNIVDSFDIIIVLSMMLLNGLTDIKYIKYQNCSTTHNSNLDTGNKNLKHISIKPNITVAHTYTSTNDLDQMLSLTPVNHSLMCISDMSASCINVLNK